MGSRSSLHNGRRVRGAFGSKSLIAVPVKQADGTVRQDVVSLSKGSRKEMRYQKAKLEFLQRKKKPQ